MLKAPDLADVLIRAGVPRARALLRAPFIAEASVAADLTTRERLAAFLGQVGHESLMWRYTDEVWGPTATQLRYERDFSLPWPMSSEQSRHPAFKLNRLAYTLGNKRAGDGSRYRGRGDIQVTGRTNTAAATRRLKALLGESTPDFVIAPQMLASYEWASMTAADYWTARGLNKWATDARELTRRINGGYTGLGDRELRTSLFLSILTTG